MSYIKNIGLSAIMFGAVIITSCSNSQTSDTTTTQQTPQKKQKVETIDFESAFIVDVRTPQEFAIGHYEGAVNIPLNTVESNLEQFKGHNQIVVYCRTGGRSGNAKSILEKNGYHNVINAINEVHLLKLKANQK
ncbi:rhodanese-like domain-containing protein [Brumimicrobium mesophilum]|uniref:rhodanese-like domain-containing protein n=1 Tax=Brumimicrobium mesophilum TaxID=392717 RepID=UPI001F17980A|nr:rhodanese-like domain-containing protein [Brumimicrobium mesophilum]